MRKVLYLLGQLNDSDVEWLITRGRKEFVPAGTVLMQEGMAIDSLYVVLHGTLGAAVPAPGGSREIVRLGCGEVVGEISFVDARPPSATVSALEDATVLAISRQELARKLEREADFAARFYRALAVFLAHRLRAAGHRLDYGAGQELHEDVTYTDELDPAVLDQVHLAGARFDEVLQRLLT
jgi:bacteriocin-type transport-associated protein